MKTVRDACQLQPNAVSVKLSDQIEQLDELNSAEGNGRAFFDRTFITQGMKDLITEGIARLVGASSQVEFPQVEFHISSNPSVAARSICPSALTYSPDTRRCRRRTAPACRTPAAFRELPSRCSTAETAPTTSSGASQRTKGRDMPAPVSPVNMRVRRRGSGS